MSKLRKIRELERFSSPAMAASSLRAVAAQIEKHTDWVAWSISVSYATEEEVRESISVKREHARKLEGRES